MAILQTFSTFRAQFALAPLSSNDNFTFVNANPDQITGAPSPTVFSQNVGRLTVFGSAVNDGIFHSQAVSATAITLVPSDALTNEGPVLCTITFQPLDPDGYESWPVDLVRLPGSGFGNAGSTLTGLPKTPPFYSHSSYTISCNAGAADAVPGTDEYDWYVSQRTDDPTIQAISVDPAPLSGGDSFSGSVVLTFEPSLLNLAAPPDLDSGDIVRVFKNVHVYVQRKSDKAIQWVDLLRNITAAV